ncbi:MAG: hypothetical protein HC828_16570 [Blastochloris sp.]|nr:hypothetical protein [Blastochloris sp.]NJO84232.1 hypothetical protein [Blastochloris sp.]
MNSNSLHFEPPKPSEMIFVLNQDSSATSEKWSMTWVADFVEPTLNGCFKVTDKSGRSRIVKRFKSKDKGMLKAWKAMT